MFVQQHTEELVGRGHAIRSSQGGGDLTTPTAGASMPSLSASTTGRASCGCNPSGGGRQGCVPSGGGGG